MKDRVYKTPRVIITVFSTLCMIWLVAHNLQELVFSLGIIEFPETDLIAMCILAFVLMRAQYHDMYLKIFAWLALLIGSFTFVTKGLIMFFSEDNWIAGWHAVNFATGCCLLLFAVEALERLRKE